MPPVDSFRSRLRGRSDARRDAQHSEATIDRGRVALGARDAARNRVPQRQLAVADWKDVLRVVPIELGERNVSAN